MATDEPPVGRQIERAAALRFCWLTGWRATSARFAKKAWPIIHPTARWYGLALRPALRVPDCGQTAQGDRLIINVPPRTAKSTIVTICFPCWVWASEPSHNFLTASYSLDLSTDHSIMRRSLLQSGWYRRMWGDKFRLAGDRNQVGQFMNDKRGAMIATSVGASAMGRGCDTAILDDPVNADQALSTRSAPRRTTGSTHTLRSRLNDPATGAMVADHAAPARTGSDRVISWSRSLASGRTFASRWRRKRTRAGPFRSRARVVQRKRGRRPDARALPIGHGRAVEGTAPELGRPVPAATVSDRREPDQAL